MARRCFFSFHYEQDVIRAAQVRNIRAIDGSQAVADHDWEQVTRGGEAGIKRWIEGQLSGRVCTIVLVGEKTANRRWINHEIAESWNRGMGVVGIRIHGLVGFDKRPSPPGPNPFDFVHFTNTSRNLSTVVKCYDPAGNSSPERYGWIAEYLERAVEEAIQIRARN